jgi:hypothetical protein
MDKLGTYDSPEVRILTVPIPDKFFLISAKRGDYYDVKDEGLYYKELHKYTVKDKATQKDVEKEKVVDCCVSLISPYIVGFEYCYNYKHLIEANLASRRVTFRVFNSPYPDKSDTASLGAIYQLKSNPRIIVEVIRVDSTHTMVMAISTRRIGWDYNNLLHEHLTSYFNPIV